MNAFYQDMIELALASVLAPFVSVLPGMALLWLGEKAGWARRGGWVSFGLAALLALSVLPALDALLVRTVGLGATTLVHLIGGGFGLAYARRLRWTWSPVFAAVASLWWVLVLLSSADMDLSSGLNQSVAVVDLVKHAAVVESIVRDGLPLVDPFFARTQAAGYYYYYYLWPAQIEWLSGGSLSGRMAYTGALVWTGPAFVALLWQVCFAGGLIRPGKERKLLGIALFLCFVAGADLPAMLIRWWFTGALEVQTDVWTEEIRFALTSMLWTPHHLAALIAVWTGLLALTGARTNGSTLRRNISIMIAGLAFASAFGMSLWIALTAGLSLLVWTMFRGRRDPAFLLMLTLAGAVAALVSIPQFLDVLGGRSDQAFPIGLTVRRVLWLRPNLEPALALPVLAMLPAVYCIEFGAFAYGAMLFRRVRPPIASSSEGLVRSLLLFTAIGGMLVATFLRSTILLNDLGWRAPWFAQLACMAWTASAMQHMPRLIRPPRMFLALIALGLLPNIYDLAGLRIVRATFFNIEPFFLNSDPEKDRSLRAAYIWANAHLPRNWVLQHEASQPKREMDFGLYGRFRTGVADRDATLFGASRDDVDGRLRRLRPLFEEDLPAQRMRALARAEGIDAIVYSRSDPLWRKIGRPPHAAHCIWRDQHACIAQISALPRRDDP